ncbi:MAG: hypothetical protein K1X74_10670 [Pirellulales bacterium]|nr:hypothetical protein [Pirellulales bacterium]
MKRYLRRLAVVLAVTGAGWVCAAGRVLPPRQFEVSINGETFQVEADRRTTLTSRKTPGTKYEVAVRVAPAQRASLGRLRLSYDRGFVASLDAEPPGATLTLTHELGFTVTIAELGPAHDETAQRRVLSQLVDVMRAASAKAAQGDVQVGSPADTDTDHGSGQVVTLRFRDRSEQDRVCAVYVLNVGRVACSCVAQVADEVAEDAQPLVDAVLDSLEEERSGQNGNP